jgi:hypothetical protein
MTRSRLPLVIAVIVATVVASFVLHEIHASPSVACHAYARGADDVGYLHPCIAGAQTRWAESAAFLVAFAGLAFGARLLLVRRP